MSGSAIERSSKERNVEGARTPPHLSSPASPFDPLQALHRTAGNRAVDRLIQENLDIGEVGSGAPALVHTEPTPEVREVLQSLRELASRTVAAPYTGEVLVALVFEALKNLDLSDPDNLRPVSVVIADVFPPDVLTAFLEQVEGTMSARQGSESVPANPYERRLRQIGRNPQTGAFGPGMLVPAAGAVGRSVTYGVESAGAFLQGLIGGLARVDASQAEVLSRRLMQSAILSTVFAAPFMAGTAVGIGKDVAESVTGAYELYENWDEVIAATHELLQALVTGEGRDLARVVGEEIGNAYAGQIMALLGEEVSIFGFTFEIGRLVGPAILLTVLSFLGITVGAGLALGTVVILARLLPYLKRFPRLVRLAKAFVARRGGERTTKLPEKEQTGDPGGGESGDFGEEVLLQRTVGGRYKEEAAEPRRPGSRAPEAAASEELALARGAGERVVVNIGGQGELPGAINLNPNTTSVDPLPKWPRWVEAGGERIGELFPRNSLDEIFSSKLPPDKVDWDAIAEGCIAALKPGGTVRLNQLGSTEGIPEALEAAGFTDIVDHFGLVTATKPGG
jgi:hypothetical protein